MRAAWPTTSATTHDDRRAAFLVLYFLGLSRVSWNTLLSVAFENYETSFYPDLNIAWVHLYIFVKVFPFIYSLKLLVNCHSKE